MHRSILALALVTAACGDNVDGNTPPTVTDLNLTTDEDTALTRALDVTDEQGDDITITVSQPANGTLTNTGTSFTYTPAANYNGTDSFTVTVSDGVAESTGTINITITPVNDAPMAVADSFATNEDVAHEAELSALLANDTDVDGDTLTITSVGNASNGAVSMVAGDVVFTPASNFTGAATYRYTISDGTLTADGTVTVTVGGVNDAPNATNDVGTTPEDTNFVVTGASLASNDTDPEGQTLTVTAVGTASTGTVMLTSGTVTYVPPANFNGTATFNYTVSDGSATDTATVTVTVTAVNDAPIAVDDAATTSQGTPVNIPASQLVANDTDVDTGTTLTVMSVANEMNGTAVLGGSPASVTFTPAAGFVGNASFEYVVTDGTATDTGLVTVTVTACTPVDDGIACTMDVCQNGQPVNLPNHLSCESDGFACTVPTCSTVNGCSETANNAVCDDAATCTTEVCSPGTSGANGAGCVITPDNTVCNDSLACSTDVCAPGTGGANGTTGCVNTSTCNDNIACTVDTCGAGGCVFTPNNSLCTNGDVCVAGSGCRTPPTSLLVTELSILGSGTTEMIELFNSGTAAALDGVKLRNNAGVTVTIRPASDPTGALGQTLTFAAGAFAWGVPNPANAGDIPAGATFVYGDPGTTFSFADTGDMVAVTGQDDAPLDEVDFRMLATNPDVAPSASEFPSLATRSTQLDVSAIVAGAVPSANDGATSWCTSFRVATTRGATNQSCSAVVINEVYYDHDNPTSGTDDRFTFIELAGPGGAVIGGFRLQGLDGATGVTTNQEPQITFAAGTRIPNNGFFVVSDVLTGTTSVPNSDLAAAADPQNDNDAIILRDASATPLTLDLVCYGTGAAAAQCEGSPARDVTPDRVGFAIARDASSTDTNANAIDFHIDPSPTPGVANDTVAPAIISYSPNDGLASGGTVVTIQGRDFADVSNNTLADNDISATFVDQTTPDTTSATDSCQLTAIDFATSVQTFTCTSPARAAGPIVGDFIVTNPTDVGGGSVTVTNGWTYTGALNETGLAGEADFCRTNTLTATATSGQATTTIQGQVFEGGLTDNTLGGAAPGILAEVGFGAFNTNPTTTGAWNFTSVTTFTGETGTNNNDDLYTGTFTAPVVAAVTTFSYVFRFSLDNGLNWTYCDGDAAGAGSNGGSDFTTATMGVLTVSP